MDRDTQKKRPENVSHKVEAYQTTLDDEPSEADDPYHDILLYEANQNDSSLGVEKCMMKQNFILNMRPQPN